MLTQIVTFLIFFAVIGCILYGRRLIKTEKVDAVFGNPERAKGGTHWVIVGSAAILLVWLYYSWDIAKGFYPKSANELCQVAKVNDSLLGLKYQFPIEERELKSTSQIRKENNNLKKLLEEIKNSKELNRNFYNFISSVSDAYADEKDLEDLINEIRSPKGTTHAGIISLKRDKVKNKIDKAFKAAELRSKEIQNEYK